MYLIDLTNDEYNILKWFVNRGYFPESVYNGMRRKENSNIYEIPEYIAYDLLESFNNDQSFLNCMNSETELHEKIINLCQSII